MKQYRDSSLERLCFLSFLLPSSVSDSASLIGSMAKVRPFPHDLPPHSARRLRYRRSSACPCRRPAVSAVLLALRLAKGRHEGADHGAHILQRFGPGRLLLRPLDRQPGDLHGFDLQRAALQRGGGIEIFVNFAGGAGQVSPIATGGDGTEFVQRQLWVIGVEFLAELTDRLVKARRAGEQVGRCRGRRFALCGQRVRARRQGPSTHLTTKLSTSSCPSFLFAC